MIFITVGNMDPFDRLIRTMDEWASSRQYTDEIIAQIGRGTYHPKSFKYTDFVTPGEYIQYFERADLIVSHAGMGTIITALEKGKPLIVMPKRASLGEQRNEHQLATVRHFQRSKQILVADTDEELKKAMDDVLASKADGSFQATSNIKFMDWPPEASLIEYVRNFVSVAN